MQHHDPGCVISRLSEISILDAGNQEIKSCLPLHSENSSGGIVCLKWDCVSWKYKWHCVSWKYKWHCVSWKYKWQCVSWKYKSRGWGTTLLKRMQVLL